MTPHPAARAAEGPGMVDGSIVGTLVRLVVSLAVVLLLLVVLARYLNNRQLGGGRAVALPGRRKPLADVEVLSASRPQPGVEPGRRPCRGRLLLVGVTETSVTVLRELDEQPEEPTPSPLQDVPRDVLQDNPPASRRTCRPAARPLGHRLVRRGAA